MTPASQSCQQAQLSLKDDLANQQLEAVLTYHCDNQDWVMLLGQGWFPNGIGTITAVNEDSITLEVNSALEVEIPRAKITGVSKLKHWREGITPQCSCKYCTTEYGAPGRPIMCHQKWQALPRESRIVIAESVED